MEGQEIKLTNKQYEEIMELASCIFKNKTLKYGDRTSLCKSYFEAISKYLVRNKLNLKCGKLVYE